MHLGIIGTSPISHDFITACQLSKSFTPSAIYSRQEASANAFLKSDEILSIYTDVASFLESDCDIIYIASPNSLHYKQAKQAILAKKHVIVEKPITTAPEELEDLMALAKQEGVFLFEAARHIHEASILTIKKFLENKSVIGGSMTFMQYSSKMPRLLAGELPNIFSHDFAGGALMDLGIYPIYLASYLFGEPNSCQYKARQLPNTIDTTGFGRLDYNNFSIQLAISKETNSLSPFELYTTDGVLVANHCQMIDTVQYRGYDGQITDIPVTKPSHYLIDEVQHFSHIIRTKNHQEEQRLLSLSHSSQRILWDMRQSAGIQFTGDHI